MRSADNYVQLMGSVEHCCVMMFQKPNKWLVFYVQAHFHFACRSDISVLKIYFARFTSKRNTIRGFMEGSSRKKQFPQQQEMPKKASRSQGWFLLWLENRLIIASCVEATRRSEIPLRPCFLRDPSAGECPMLVSARKPLDKEISPLQKRFPKS